MASKIFNSDNLNNIIFIILLLVIIFIVCCKSISIHRNIIEQFDEHNNIDDEIDDALKDVLSSIEEEVEFRSWRIRFNYIKI